MTYTVKYKPSSGWFWRTIKNVKGDLISTDLPQVRVFILDNEARIEIPIIGTQFQFCSNRFLVIKSMVEKEVGQKLPIG